MIFFDSISSQGGAFRGEDQENNDQLAAKFVKGS